MYQLPYSTRIPRSHHPSGSKRKVPPQVTELRIRGTSGRSRALSPSVHFALQKINGSATDMAQKHYLESELSGTNSGLHNSFRKLPKIILLNCLMLLTLLPVLNHQVTDWRVNSSCGLKVRFLLAWTVSFNIHPHLASQVSNHESWGC